MIKLNDVVATWIDQEWGFINKPTTYYQLIDYYKEFIFTNNVWNQIGTLDM